MTTTINLQTNQVFINGKEANSQFPSSYEESEEKFNNPDYQGLIDEAEFQRFFGYYPTEDVENLNDSDEAWYLLEGKTAAVIVDKLRFGSFVIETAETA